MFSACWVTFVVFITKVCPRGQRADIQKICQKCTGSPELYDWLYLGFMAMLPLVLHWFFIEWYSGKKRYSEEFVFISKPYRLSQTKCFID